MTALKVEFLGLPLDNLSLEESLARLEEFVREGRPRQVFTPNAALTVWANLDPFLMGVYRSTDLLTPDGMGVFLASRLLGVPVKANVPAVSLFFELLKQGAVKKYRFYFLGARPKVVERAVANMRTRHPGLQIVGFHHGHYSPEEEEAVVEGIRACRPDVVFVAMSTPQKELFIHENKERIGAAVFVGVGGSFDVAAGVTRLAPLWMRNAGLEWLYRLIQEPRRLWRRYATTHPAFLYLVAKALVKQHTYRRDHADSRSR